jgi:hypothetical protein
LYGAVTMVDMETVQKSWFTSLPHSSNVKNSLVAP